MHTSERNPAQTHSRALRHKTTNCGPAFRHHRLSIATAFLWAIAFAVVLPTAADAQSWMKNLEDAGKRLLDHAVDKITGPSEGQPNPQTAPTPQLPSESKPSYPRDQVREVQRLLIDLGYKPGAVDGTYIPATAAAIRAYQSDRGLPQTGAPSSELIAHLKETQAAKLAAGAAQTPTGSAPKQQTSQPGGGMIAPAPEGAPVTTAQDQSSETKTKSKSSTQSSASPTAPPPSTAAEIDPVAPAGATIGAKLSDVGAALSAGGYRGAPCAGDRRGYTKQVGAGRIDVTLYAGKGCPADAPVTGITYRQTRIPIGGSPGEIVGRAARRLGADPKCAILDQRVAVCDWPSPPVAPAVKNVRLWYEGPSDPTLRIILTAVDDLGLNRSGTESRPANATTQGKMERPIDAAEPAKKSAVASEKGPFEIEAAQLGMTTAQVSAALRAKGFGPSDGGRGAQFVNEGGKPHQPGSTTVTVSYLPGYKNGPPEQAQSLISRLTHSSRSPSDWQKVNEQIYGELVAKYGEPEKCMGQKSSSHNCTWVSQFDGWLATLDWQGNVSWATITLKASNVDRSKFSRLASVAPASSSPFAPSSSAPQSEQTLGKADGESASIGFDLLAPYGVRIGMSYSDVEAALKTIGFTGNNCVWYRNEGTRKLKMSFQTTGQRGTSFCGEGGLVGLIALEYVDPRGLGAPPENLIEIMNKKIGKDAKCNTVLKNFDCRWESPPIPPLVREISTSLRPGVIDYRIRAIQNFQSRVESPAKTAARDEAQPWWTQELAKMDAAAQTVKFTGSTRFEQLAPQEKQRLSGEATTVYEYCRKKDVFNSLHDCRCVAGKFIDARLANEQTQKAAGIGQPPGVQQKWAPEWEKYQTARRDSTTELITIADRVADQCPNKPGAADYGYQQCTKTYAYRLQNRDDLKAFCTCYADTFAAIYMNNPKSNVSTLTGAGSGALLECTQKGHPSPMRR